MNMTEYKRIYRTALKLILIFCFLAVLKSTDAYYAPYLLIGIAGAICTVSIHSSNAEVHGGAGAVILPLLFGIAYTAANYSLFTEPDLSFFAGSAARIICGLLSFLLCFAGGYTAFRSILLCMAGTGRRRIGKLIFTEVQGKSGAGAFFVTFTAVAVIDCLVLFLAKYPGVLTEDSISQIEQLTSGVYSNHHPFYHTMVIKAVLGLGLRLFSGDYNRAVALYSVFQIAVMACTFGYVSATARRMGASRIFIAASSVFFALLPCHFMYSFTMWKDVLFGAAFTAFTVTVFRFLAGIGKRGFGMCFLIIVSGLGTCLFRSNGWMAFLIGTAVFLIMFAKKELKLSITLIVIVIAAFILKHPVLDAVGVSKTDTIESLSIPAQQIARVIVECRDDLSDDDYELLEKVIDIDFVHVIYLDYISNPVKELVRSTGDQEYLKEHFSDYLKLWIRLGLSHPKQYFEAYVEQTKGYWNSGYDFWRTTDFVYENRFGIAKDIRVKGAESLIEQYIYIFEKHEMLSIFQSIGLYVWAALILAYTAVRAHRRAALFLFIPLFAYILSLLAATPVFAEFRYTYLLFCAFPFLICAVFYDEEGMING